MLALWYKAQMNTRQSAHTRNPDPNPWRLPRIPYFSRSLLLLVYLPLLHTCLAALFLNTSSNTFEWSFLPEIGLRLWSMTALLLVFLIALERSGVPRDDVLNSWQFVLKYFLAAVVCLLLTGFLNSQFESKITTNAPASPAGPIIILSFEILLFAAMRSVLAQQQINHALEIHFRSAQYQALRAQLQPHFLFNSLNLISSEIDHNPALATELLDKLAELLRGTLNAAEKPLITLREEFDLLERYLHIQKSRFGERLEFEINRQQAELAALLPPMLLQPLVENSIKHGIAPFKRGGKVDIKSWVEEDFLLIMVHDTGQGFASQVSFGNGLRLVQDSIELLYADDSQNASRGFDIQSTPGTGTTVMLRLPLRHVGE